MVAGVDLYNYYEADGTMVRAVKGDLVDVSDTELERGQNIVGPGGPALQTPQEVADKAVGEANEAAKVAQDTADAAQAYADQVAKAGVFTPNEAVTPTTQALTGNLGPTQTGTVTTRK